MMAEKRNPGHSDLADLALFSHGDLPLKSRWRVGRHVKRCPDCEQHVLLFRSAQAELKHEAKTETLTGFEAIADWQRLEREMLGNIGVGLAAARCIENVGRKRTILYRIAFALGLTGLFIAGWLTHIPREETDHLFASLHRLVTLDRQPRPTGIVLRTTPDGIAVGAQGSTLTILHPATAIVSLSGASAVSARYVDDDTGEVTITKVYGQ
jgi:hypothetical protein